MSLAERNNPFRGPSPSHTYHSSENSPDTPRPPTLPSMSNLLNPWTSLTDHHTQQPMASQYQPSYAMYSESMWQTPNGPSIRPEHQNYPPPPFPPPSYFSQPPTEPISMSQGYAQDPAMPSKRNQPILKRRQFKKAKIERRRDSSKNLGSERTLSPLQSRSLEPQVHQPLPKYDDGHKYQAYVNSESSGSHMSTMNQHNSLQSRSIPSEPPRSSNPPAGPQYVLRMRQNPKAARACGFGERDRRVVDPPPILTMEISDPNASPEELATLRKQDFAVVHCTLWDPTTDSDAGTMPTTVEKRPQRRLVGNLVSSLFAGKDENNQDGCFFTFPDLSVRTPGTYCLRFSLTILDPRQMGIPGARSPIRSIIKSEPFNVFNAKDFKGMMASTPLAVTLKAQGCLIAVKKGSAKSNV